LLFEKEGCCLENILRNSAAAELENIYSKVISLIDGSFDKYGHIALRVTFCCPWQLHCCTRISLSFVLLEMDGSTFETGDLI
jgi:hypothetical protein